MKSYREFISEKMFSISLSTIVKTLLATGKAVIFYRLELVTDVILKPHIVYLSDFGAGILFSSDVGNLLCWC